MTIDLTDVKVFFFKAMLQGYARSVEKAMAYDMPGYKDIDFHEGDWRCLDRYCTTPLSDKSAGSTTIWYRSTPVWVMHYGGQYKEEVIDFLKLALRCNYEEAIFLGCRGPEWFTHQRSSLLYTNALFPGSQHFGAFSGFESIKDTADNNRLLGYHGYMGMSLLP